MTFNATSNTNCQQNDASTINYYLLAVICYYRKEFDHALNNLAKIHQPLKYNEAIIVSTYYCLLKTLKTK